VLNLLRRTILGREEGEVEIIADAAYPAINREAS
jgi:hypothetical protein